MLAKLLFGNQIQDDFDGGECEINDYFNFIATDYGNKFMSGIKSNYTGIIYITEKEIDNAIKILEKYGVKKSLAVDSILNAMVGLNIKVKNNKD